MKFADLPERAQVHRVRKVAVEALGQYPVEVARVRLLLHGFNTTFRVDAASGEKFALRVDTNRRKPLAALHAEMDWLAAIARDTDIVVPVPQETRDGDLHTIVESEDLGRPVQVAMMSWLPGKDLDEPDAASLRELGRHTALLHQHAQGWRRPKRAVFPPMASVLMDTNDRIRPGSPLFTSDQHATFVEALDHAEPLFDQMVAADTQIPIHGDLHGGNVKWRHERMAIFDFDDAGMGVPAQDLAITMYYQKPVPGLKEALFEGYESVTSLPPFTSDQYEAAVASRALLLVNELIEVNTRELRDLLPKFFENTKLRLQHYLDTGTYRPDVPGVVPLS